MAWAKLWVYVNVPLQCGTAVCGVQWESIGPVLSFVFWGHSPTTIVLRTGFLFFEKSCQSGERGASDFWKLLSSMESNFQRPEVLISLFL